MREKLPDSRLVRFLEDTTQSGGVDFHLHSYFSDGAQSPTALVEEVLRKKLFAFSLTDHDTMAGNFEARDALRQICPTSRDISDYKPGDEKRKGEIPWFVPGVECSTQFEDQEIHLLGYFTEVDPPEMKQFLKNQADLRVKRNEAMINKLNALGYQITPFEFRRYGVDQTVLGRVHMALWLVEYAGFPSIKEAFRRLLNEGCPAFVPREKHTVEEVAGAIAKSGGVTVLAHPQQYRWCEDINSPETTQSLTRCFSDCQSMGVLGVECFHGQASQEESQLMSEVAKGLGMICTAGSDSHGRDDQHAHMYEGGTVFNLD